MLRVHHIGYAVRNLNDSIAEFRKLGFTPVGASTEDRGRRVEIQFIRSGAYVVELIAPLGESSPLLGILNRNNDTPYHLCYETDDLRADLARLTEDGYLPVDAPSPAPAMNQCAATFLYKRRVGLIELVERPADAPGQDAGVEP